MTLLPSPSLSIPIYPIQLNYRKTAFRFLNLYYQLFQRLINTAQNKVNNAAIPIKRRIAKCNQQSREHNCLPLIIFSCLSSDHLKLNTLKISQKAIPKLWTLLAVSYIFPIRSFYVISANRVIAKGAKIPIAKPKIARIITSPFKLKVKA